MVVSLTRQGGGSFNYREKPDGGQMGQGARWGQVEYLEVDIFLAAFGVAGHSVDVFLATLFLRPCRC